MNADNMTGLVLSGGGTCGSYEIGVWRALRETEWEKRIGAISASSAGALNALLFAQGNLDTAIRVWEEFRERDLLAIRNPLEHGSYGLFSQRRIAGIVDRNITRWDLIKERELYISVSIVDPPLPKEKMISLIRREGGKAAYIPLAGLSAEEIREVVLASIAMPVIYPSRMIHGKRCVDGDFADKIPYRPLAERGYDKILVIHLNPYDKVARHEHEFHGETADNGRVQFHHLYPEKQLGSFMWTSPSLVAERMERGYREGKKFIQEIRW